MSVSIKKLSDEEWLVIIRHNGDYHELVASCKTEAIVKAKAFCMRNDIPWREC